MILVISSNWEAYLPLCLHFQCLVGYLVQGKSPLGSIWKHMIIFICVHAPMGTWCVQKHVEAKGQPLVSLLRHHLS